MICTSTINLRSERTRIRMREQTPYAVAKALGDRGIFTWHGNFYALGLTECLDIESSGGLLRIGLVHYNTFDDITFAKRSPDKVAPVKRF